MFTLPCLASLQRPWESLRSRSSPHSCFCFLTPTWWPSSGLCSEPCLLLLQTLWIKFSFFFLWHCSLPVIIHYFYKSRPSAGQQYSLLKLGLGRMHLVEERAQGSLTNVWSKTVSLSTPYPPCKHPQGCVPEPWSIKAMGLIINNHEVNWL